MVNVCSTAHWTIYFDFGQEMLSHYPCPKECGQDNGNKVLGLEFQDILDSYSIISKPTMVKRNPIANANWQTTSCLSLNKTGLMTSIISSNSVSMLYKATSLIVGPYSLQQFVLGCDMLFHQKIIIDWEVSRHAYQANAAQQSKGYLQIYIPQLSSQ